MLHESHPFGVGGFSHGGINPERQIIGICATAKEVFFVMLVEELIRRHAITHGLECFLLLAIDFCEVNAFRNFVPTLQNLILSEEVVFNETVSTYRST